MTLLDWLSILACLVGMFLPAFVAGALFLVFGKFIVEYVE